MRASFFAVSLVVLACPVSGSAQCAGDCSGDGAVGIEELVRAVSIALGEAAIGECPAADADGDGAVVVSELVASVNHALQGCPLDDVPCNGDPELCARGFDQVAYPTTHNAMANLEDGFSGPNQTFGIPRQLRDGIRALMLDTYRFSFCEGGALNGRACPLDGDCGAGERCVTDLFLCHGTCLLGRKPLVEALEEIRRFLEAYSGQVVSIIFESYISAAETASAFAESGLVDYVLVQPEAAPWPTLAEMVEENTRLVVFTDDPDDGGFPWYHYVWDHAFETPFSFEEPEDLSCRANRGAAGNPLFILNHFLTQVVGAPGLAEQINFNPLFIDRAEECRLEHGQMPNFITVDFYEIGDVFAVVEELNGAHGPQ